MPTARLSGRCSSNWYAAAAAVFLAFLAMDRKRLSEADYALLATFIGFFIFTGNMGYIPNIDAAEYIVHEIYPFIRQKYPDIRIALCGATPSPRVLALENKQITVTGWVDDMRDFYARSRIFIAPMRLGTGLQNKLLEAMSMRIPCITSPLAATPLNAKANHDILVCNSTLGYVDAIDNLLKDAEHYEQIAGNGQTFVQANYNWERTSRILEELITESE